MSNPDSNKPREFWIQDTAAEVYSATEVSCYDEKVNPSIIDEWHVVEHSAYEAQAKEIEELKTEILRLQELSDKQGAMPKALLQMADKNTELTLQVGKLTQERDDYRQELEGLQSDAELYFDRVKDDGSSNAYSLGRYDTYKWIEQKAREVLAKWRGQTHGPKL